MLNKDIILNIAEFLSDREKIRLTMTSLCMNELKYIFIYKQKISLDKIFKLSYFNNFESIEIKVKTRSVRPKNTKYIHFITHTCDIPHIITHLKFSDDFDSPIQGYIPQSVTHLTFGRAFDQSIDHSIPKSITHLTFGAVFNQPIKNNIPKSVTHLIFGNNFNQHIKDNIPESVTHLEFGYLFKKTINYIPKTVVEIKLDEDYILEISPDIQQKVVYY
jgi:hypothetical protein